MQSLCPVAPVLALHACPPVYVTPLRLSLTVLDRLQSELMQLMVRGQPPCRAAPKRPLCSALHSTRSRGVPSPPLLMRSPRRTRLALFYALTCCPPHAMPGAACI